MPNRHSDTSDSTNGEEYRVEDNPVLKVPPHPNLHSTQLFPSGSYSVPQPASSIILRQVEGQSPKTEQDGHSSTVLQRSTTVTSTGEPFYSVFSPNQKRFIVFIASWAGFFSPVSATIFLPALNTLARDLKVSDSLINLTLTSYMVFQGLAPAFIGSLTDAAGRRPAYLVCFVIYIAANIGLALQHSYAALFVLRCLQSTGSSATIAMASAVVSDIATPSERGKYMGLTIAGSLLGPAVGPVLGGVLTQFLSWRATFWFLVIFSGAFLVVFGIFFPETARSVVGNGSVPPKGLNMSLMNYLAVRESRREAASAAEPVQLSPAGGESTSDKRHKTTFPNPLASIKILLDRSNALLLLYTGFLFAAFYDVTATVPSQFAAKYHYNDLQIGLCYVPFGSGSLIAALVNGRLVDRNFRRWCNKLDVSIKKGRDQDLSNFPIEKARLQIALPAVYVATALLLVFGWVLHFEGPVAVLLVVMFFAAFAMSIAFNVASTLLIDFYPRRAATATAANNLVRCLLGAGATAVILPMINGMGVGWTYTTLSLFLVATSPMLWILMSKGMEWRKIRTAKDEARMRTKKESDTSLEEGHEKMDLKITERRLSGDCVREEASKLDFCAKEKIGRPDEIQASR